MPDVIEIEIEAPETELADAGVLTINWGAFSQDAMPQDMFAAIRFPVLFSTNKRTGDGRMLGQFKGPRQLPIPVLIQRRTKSGHDEALVVGHIASIEQTDANTFTAFGWLLNDKAGHMAARMIRSQSLRGCSPDLCDVTYTVMEDGDTILFDTFSIGATTLVPVPAFDNTFVELMDPSVDIPDGENDEVIAALTALPMKDIEDIVVPHSFFAEPTGEPGPVRVDEDGRVHGYLALWNQCHVGMTGRCVRAPKSPTNYAHFANHAVRTDEGFVNTGPLVMGGAHAPLGQTPQAVSDFYATTSRAWADVAIGENNHGIWVSGIVRPGTTAEMIYAARASSLSGHWMRVGGRVDLVAALSVNSPGYNIARPRVFASEDILMEIVAAGAIEQDFAPEMEILDGSTADMVKFLFAAEMKRQSDEVLASIGQYVTGNARGEKRIAPYSRGMSSEDGEMSAHDIKNEVDDLLAEVAEFRREMPDADCGCGGDA